MKDSKFIEAYDFTEPLTVVRNISSEIFKDLYIGFSWRELTGTLNGKITFYATDHDFDESDYAKLSEHNIDAADNEDDKLIITTSKRYAKIKVVIQPNGITGGVLNASIRGV